jgi:hypothetical protein
VLQAHDKIDQVEDPAYWKSLNPKLSIDSKARSTFWKPKRFDSAWPTIRSNLITEGYFQSPGFLSKSRQTKMLAAVESLRSHGWPEPFVFVYDIFWQAPKRLQFLLGRILGKDFRMLPDFWVWYVDNQKYESGWRRHRDRDADCIGPDGLPQSLTIWIALSDARIDNGCIYILPADKDPRYRKDFTELALDNPFDVRALECSAGTLFAWNQVVLHWGGNSHPIAPNPRVSFAYEFQRQDVPAHNFPQLDPARMPRFEQRLALIAKQVLQYKHMYSLSDQMVDIAERLATSYALPKSL